MSRSAQVTKVTFLSILIFANFTYHFGQESPIYSLPAGTHLKVKLDLELSSKVASKDDTFLTKVVEPVVIRDVVVVPEGTVVEGRVVRAESAAAGNKNGSLELVFESMRLMNTSRSIEGILLTKVKAEPSGPFNLLSILGGTAAGAAIGAVAGSAAAGAAIGLGTGSSIAFLRKGRDVKLKKGEELEIELKKGIVLPVLDY